MSISGRQKDQLARNELPRSNYAGALDEKRNSPRLRQVLSRRRSPAAEQIVAKQKQIFSSLRQRHYPVITRRPRLFPGFVSSAVHPDRTWEIQVC